MNPPVAPVPEVICVRCGHRNAGDSSRCGSCGVLLDPSAASAASETGVAKVPASKDPVAPRTKPIVFWGVWLYFGPTAMMAGVLAYTSLAPILSDRPDGLDVASAIGIVVMCGLYGVSSCWALWAVTAGYLKRH